MKVGRICRHLVHLARIWPASAQLRPSSANCGRCRLRWPNFGRLRLKLDPSRATRTRPEPALFRPLLAPASTGIWRFRQIWPRFRRTPACMPAGAVAVSVSFLRHLRLVGIPPHHPDPLEVAPPLKIVPVGSWAFNADRLAMALSSPRLIPTGQGACGPQESASAHSAEFAASSDCAPPTHLGGRLFVPTPRCHTVRAGPASRIVFERERHSHEMASKIRQRTDSTDDPRPLHPRFSELSVLSVQFVSDAPFPL